MAEPRTSAGRDLRRHLFPKITPFVMQKVTEHIIAIEIEAYELGCAATASALRSTPAAPEEDEALPGHQTPGEFHDYRVACVKCGEPGYLHVSWRPEKTPETDALTFATTEEADRE